MKAKKTLNDIKMEVHHVQRNEHQNDYYFQNNSKDNPMQQNFTNNQFQYPTSSNFQPTNLPSQF